MSKFILTHDFARTILSTYKGELYVFIIITELQKKFTLFTHAVNCIFRAYSSGKTERVNHIKDFLILCV
jgi:hypothetical protein